MSATPTTGLGFQNFFQATLTSDITSSSTDIFLDAIPNSSEGFLVIDPSSTTSREVIFYNSKTALKVTCPSAADGRGQDDTTASAHTSGTTVIIAPVAAYFEALQTLQSVPNDKVLERHIDWSTIPMGLFYMNTTQTSFPGTTFTKIKLDSTGYNQGLTFDGATNYRITMPTAGKYHIDACAQTQAVTGVFWTTAIYKNGTLMKQGQIVYTNTSTALWNSISFDEEFAAGDYIELWGYFSGGSISVINGRANTFLNVRYVGS